MRYEPGEPEELPGDDVLPVLFVLYEVVWPEDEEAAQEYRVAFWGLAFPDRAIVYGCRDAAGFGTRGVHESANDAFLLYNRVADLELYWPHGRPDFAEDLGDFLQRTFPLDATG